MAKKILIKSSGVEGKVPQTTDLDLGELAINFNDGKLYLKKDDGVDETIVEIGAGGGGGSNTKASEWVRVEYTTGALVEELTWSSGISNVTLLTDNTVNSNLLISIEFSGGADAHATPPSSFLTYGWVAGTQFYNIVPTRNSGTLKATSINPGVPLEPGTPLIPNFGDGYIIESIDIQQGSTGASGTGQPFDFNKSHAYVVMGW